MDREWIVDEEGVTCPACGENVYHCCCSADRREASQLSRFRSIIALREMILFFTLELPLN